MITAYGQTLSEVWLVNGPEGQIAFVSESDAMQYLRDHELYGEALRVPLYETRAVPDQKIAEE